MPGKAGSSEQHQGVQRVAVDGQGVRDEAVVRPDRHVEVNSFRSRRIRPLTGSISYLFRGPGGISITTSNSTLPLPVSRGPPGTARPPGSDGPWVPRRMPG